jgi:hypothetical protein
VSALDVDSLGFKTVGASESPHVSVRKMGGKLGKMPATASVPRWPWVLRLFGLSGGALLAGALLTPVAAQSHPLFSLPLIALYALGTFAGRVVGRSSPGEQVI